MEKCLCKKYQGSVSCEASTQYSPGGASCQPQHMAYINPFCNHCRAVCKWHSKKREREPERKKCCGYIKKKVVRCNQGEKREGSERNTKRTGLHALFRTGSPTNRCYLWGPPRKSASAFARYFSIPVFATVSALGRSERKANNVCQKRQKQMPQTIHQNEEKRSAQKRIKCFVCGERCFSENLIDCAFKSLQNTPPFWLLWKRQANLCSVLSQAYCQRGTDTDKIVLQGCIKLVFAKTEAAKISF